MESISNFSMVFQVYIFILVGIFGLIIGSFLNVVGLRLLSDESIVFPSSKCPQCQQKLNWYDNIPVLSYFILGGKCRNCKKEISFQYPLVEFSTAFLFLTIFFIYGLTLNTLFLWVLTAGMIVICITDLREKLIYDITSMPLIPIGLVYNFFDIGNSSAGIVHFAGIPLQQAFVSAVIGAILGAAFFEIFSRLGLLLVGEYAFGGGDTVIAAALGAWFGWKLIIIIIVLSFLFQLIVGIPIILVNMYKDKDYKSIIATVVLLLSLGIPYIGKATGATATLEGALAFILLSFGVAGICIFIILKGVKERQSFTFIPFGPALVFGGFVVMFYGQQLLNWYFR